MTRPSVALVLAALLLGGACKVKTSEPELDKAPEGTIVVDEASKVVRTGKVGVKDPQQATYVLVNVENRSGEERHVAVDAILHGPGGAEIGPTNLDEHRIPPGEMRTFALVHAGVVENVESVSFRVRGSAKTKYPPAVEVQGDSLERGEDGTPVAVNLRVKNKEDMPAVATVVCAFYGEGGAILSRPFVILELDKGGSRPFRFDAPEGTQDHFCWISEILL